MLQSRQDFSLTDQTALHGFDDLKWRTFEMSRDFSLIKQHIYLKPTSNHVGYDSPFFSQNDQPFCKVFFLYVFLFGQVVLFPTWVILELIEGWILHRPAQGSELDAVGKHAGREGGNTNHHVLDLVP